MYQRNGEAKQCLGNATGKSVDHCVYRRLEALFEHHLLSPVSLQLSRLHDGKATRPQSFRGTTYHLVHDLSGATFLVNDARHNAHQLRV